MTVLAGSEGRWKYEGGGAPRAPPPEPRTPEPGPIRALDELWKLRDCVVCELLEGWHCCIDELAEAAAVALENGTASSRECWARPRRMAGDSSAVCLCARGIVGL